MASNPLNDFSRIANPGGLPAVAAKPSKAKVEQPHDFFRGMKFTVPLTQRLLKEVGEGWVDPNDEIYNSIIDLQNQGIQQADGTIVDVEEIFVDKQGREVTYLRALVPALNSEEVVLSSDNILVCF